MGIIDNITKELKLSPPHRITWLIVAFLIALSNALFYLFRQDLQGITDKIFLPLIVALSGLFWLAIGLSASLFILYKKSIPICQADKFNDYKFNVQAGSWINKNNQADRICAKCKTENIFSPISIKQGKGVFICPRCSNKSLNIPFVGFVGNGKYIVVEE